MVSSCKFPLPPGSIGVVFKGTPPKVVRITAESPMAGKIKVGYVFESLYLKDGSEYENLSTTDLVHILAEHKDEEGRKMKLHIVLPDTTTLSLPAGDVGLTIAGVPPMIKTIQDPALQAKIRAGLAIDSLALADGTIMSGLTTEEIVVALKDDSASEGRVLTLKNCQTATLSAKSITLPAEKEVTLPTGTLGASFKGNPATVSALAAESPMRGSFRVGMIVDSLTLPDGTVYSGLSAGDFSVSLTNSIETEGRIVCLKNPSSKNLAKSSTTKVLLPKGDLGLTFGGIPATVTAVAADSPLLGKVKPGLVVETIILADESEFDYLDSADAIDTLANSADTEGRSIIFSNYALPDEIEVALPAGSLGVTFEGTSQKPPMITAVDAESPVVGLFKVGMVVDVLTLEDGQVCCEMDSPTLTKMLVHNAESAGRVVILKNPATTTMTKTGSAKLPAERTVVLPAGKKLGFMLRLGSPPVIAKVKSDCPVKEELAVGLAIDTVTLPDGQVFMELTPSDLVRILQEHSECESRTLLLRNPAVGANLMMKKPDSKEVSLPAGPVGIVFKGTPPMISRLTDACPLKSELTVGLFVDMVTLDDGTVMSGLTTTELVAVLKEEAASGGRTLLLKNPKTKEPSAKDTILPEEKAVVLPADSIGVSFKGTPPKVNRIIDESPMKGQFRVGMVVDSLEIPGVGEEAAKTFAGMSSLELVKVIRDTKGMEGRKIVLKNPTATLTEKKGDFSADPDIDMDMSVKE